MSDRMQIRHSLAGSSMMRGRPVFDGFNPKGIFNVQLVDRFGNPLTDKLIVPNGIKVAAKDALFNSFFNSGTRWTNWYIGLIDSTNYTSDQPTDISTSHTGWQEFVSYEWGVSNDTGSRQGWGQGTSSSGQITNASQLVYTFTANGSIQGIFVTSQSVRNTWGSGDLLWSTALFSAALSVANGDQLKITYTVSA